MIENSVFQFLKKLQENNNREWFSLHKSNFQKEEIKIKQFFNEVYIDLQKIDSLESMQIFRIYRDVRFSKDKSPYKNHFSVGFTRTKPHLRGGMYLHIEPNNSFVGGGFWAPKASDLFRIRKEFEMDDLEIRTILKDKNFISYFGSIQGDELITAPKGFDKNHQAIDLIKKKQYLISRKFKDSEVLSPNFKEEILYTFKAMKPFFDYMSEILGTDLNGEPIY